eukprot:361080-Chlamydomonas_euryale.AAC.3
MERAHNEHGESTEPAWPHSPRGEDRGISREERGSTWNKGRKNVACGRAAVHAGHREEKRRHQQRGERQHVEQGEVKGGNDMRPRCGAHNTRKGQGGHIAQKEEATKGRTGGQEGTGWGRGPAACCHDAGAGKGGGGEGAPARSRASPLPRTEREAMPGTAGGQRDSSMRRGRGGA